MNRFELREALDAAGVARHDYSLQDVPPNFVSDSTFVLRQRGDRWVVFFSERGLERDPKQFASEDEACEYLLAELTRPPAPVGPPPTDEELARAKRLAEASRERHRAFLVSQGLDPDTGQPVDSTDRAADRQADRPSDQPSDRHDPRGAVSVLPAAVSLTDRDHEFAIALPAGWRYVDLLDPDAAEWAGPELDSVLAAAREGGPDARMLMFRSLITHTPEGEPLTAGLTVALADAGTPIASQPLTDLSPTEAELHALELPVGSGVRITRMVQAPQLGQTGAPRMLSVQYVLHTERGLLTIGFTTGQASHPEAWTELFDAMAATAELA